MMAYGSHNDQLILRVRRIFDVVYLLYGLLLSVTVAVCGHHTISVQSVVPPSM
jgi:hypothetical protein